MINLETIEPLIYLVPAIFTELGAATCSYYFKAKSENKVKIILGGICGGIGAPLLISGYHGKRDALELYNSNCANQSTGEFRLGVIPNGLGLSYNF